MPASDVEPQFTSLIDVVFGGGPLGISVTESHHGVPVVSGFVPTAAGADAPVAKCGRVLLGDYVVAVDGSPCYLMSYGEVIDRVRARSTPPSQSHSLPPPPQIRRSPRPIRLRFGKLARAGAARGPPAPVPCVDLRSGAVSLPRAQPSDAQ